MFIIMRSFLALFIALCFLLAYQGEFSHGSPNPDPDPVADPEPIADANPDANPAVLPHVHDGEEDPDHHLFADPGTLGSRGAEALNATLFHIDKARKEVVAHEKGHVKSTQTSNESPNSTPSGSNPTTSSASESSSDDVQVIDFPGPLTPDSPSPSLTPNGIPVDTKIWGKGDAQALPIVEDPRTCDSSMDGNILDGVNGGTIIDDEADAIANGVSFISNSIAVDKFLQDPSDSVSELEAKLVGEASISSESDVPKLVYDRIRAVVSEFSKLSRQGLDSVCISLIFLVFYGLCTYFIVS
jgi:hypothetical protein